MGSGSEKRRTKSAELISTTPFEPFKDHEDQKPTPEPLRPKPGNGILIVTLTAAIKVALLKVILKVTLLIGALSELLCKEPVLTCSSSRRLTSSGLPSCAARCRGEAP